MTDETRKIAALPADRLKLAEQISQVCHFVAPHGTEPEDALRPEFWLHAQNTPHVKLQPDYEIVARAEDYSWYARYLVTSVANKTVRLEMLFAKRLGAEAPAVEVTGFDVTFVPGGNVKYRVFRVADKQPIKDGFGTRQEAEDWMRTNLAVRVAA